MMRSILFDKYSNLWRNVSWNGGAVKSVLTEELNLYSGSFCRNRTKIEKHADEGTGNR
jgi:hypothetical protein